MSSSAVTLRSAKITDAIDRGAETARRRARCDLPLVEQDPFPRAPAPTFDPPSERTRVDNLTCAMDIVRPVARCRFGHQNLAPDIEAVTAADRRAVRHQLVPARVRGVHPRHLVTPSGPTE
jgi:hypothetical protein